MRRLLLALLISFFSLPLAAENSLTIANAWVREGPPVVPMLAAYMTFSNPTDKDIEISSVESDNFGSIEMHRTVVENGVARMLAQPSIVIPAHGELKLEPGGYHLMLMDIKQPVQAGDTVNFHFCLQDGSCFDQTVPVQKDMGDGEMHMHHMMHDMHNQD